LALVVFGAYHSYPKNATQVFFSRCNVIVL